MANMTSNNQRDFKHNNNLMTNSQKVCEIFTVFMKWMMNLKAK